MSYKPLNQKEIEWHDANYNLPGRIIIQLERANALEAAAEALRVAQRTYMANRGDNELGKKVAEAAENLDKALASYRGAES